MVLTAGEHLGPYEILSLLGKGGMGEVYRARDPRVGRDVAIKVSAKEFEERFAREARTIASLNHPNICHLYDVGPDYLVMELVEGSTLAERLNQGRLPLEESLNVARQIADALEAAHEKGITHRDLKPGNIKIKADGTVKVLDFGLAKIGGTPVAEMEHSPTLTMGQTEAGVILGTAAYMSPEQAKGKPVDHRADIYAFGVVLYEMVTGQRLHHGDTTTEVLASVIKEEPQWDKVPVQLRKLLRLCLEKDPQKRLRHIANVMALVDDAPVAATSGPEAPRVPKSGPRWMWIGVATVVVLAAAGIALWAPWRTRTTAQEIRFQIPVPEKFTFNPGTAATLSPDGRWLAFPAVGPDNVARMYIRSLSSLETKPLEGSDVGVISAPPFWSDDSKFVVYYSGGKLKKNNVTGGPPQIITDTRSAQGGSWNRANVVLYSGFGAVMRVNAAGGTGIPLTSGSGNPATPPTAANSLDLWPQFLPDGRRFLYFHSSIKPELTGVYVGSIDAKPDQQSTKPLLLSDREAYYAPAEEGGAGWLLFVREGSLMAQRFDPDKLQLSGDPAPVAGPVGSFAQVNYAMFSISTTGVLLYRGGGSGGFQLIWFDAQGRPDGTLGETGQFGYPAISPDGKRVAVSQGGGQGNQDIWVWDIERGNRSLRLTFDPGADTSPVWFPDGSKIVFASARAGHFDLYTHAADGTGEDQLLLKSDEDKTPTGFSKDGRFLAYTSSNPKTQTDVWIVPMEGDRKPVLFQGKEYNEGLAQFSPDRRWIAYLSNESGTPEVYVRPFAPDSNGASADSGGKWMISRGGGIAPRWRGSQLFYMAVDGRVMAVDVTTVSQAGVPRLLFQAPVPPNNLVGFGDITADGKRFLFVAPQGASGAPLPFTVVTNWQASLKK